MSYDLLICIMALYICTHYTCAYHMHIHTHRGQNPKCEILYSNTCVNINSLNLSAEEMCWLSSFYFFLTRSCVNSLFQYWRDLRGESAATWSDAPLSRTCPVEQNPGVLPNSLGFSSQPAGSVPVPRLPPNHPAPKSTYSPASSMEPCVYINIHSCNFNHYYYLLLLWFSPELLQLWLLKVLWGEEVVLA